MSLFPQHLCPGQSITVHTGVAAAVPCFPVLRTLIRDPLGQLVFEEQRQLLTSGAIPALEVPAERSLADGLHETPPLLVIANQLRAGERARAELMRVLHETGHSSHAFRCWHVPDTAPLGRYEVEVVLWVDGNGYGSATAQSDHFFVEKLSIAELQPLGDAGVRARIMNHSPQPTHARLVEYRRSASGLTMAERGVALAPSALTELSTHAERALLVYAEDAGVLVLGRREADACYVRNQLCGWMPSRDESVVVNNRSSGKSYTLRGPARAVWLAADGLSPASELRALSAEAFEALCRAQLLTQL